MKLTSLIHELALSSLLWSHRGLFVRSITSSVHQRKRRNGLRVNAKSIVVLPMTEREVCQELVKYRWQMTHKGPRSFMQWV